MEFLRELPPESVDLLYEDSPFDARVGFRPHTLEGSSVPHPHSTGLPLPALADAAAWRFSEYARILRPGGTLMIHANRHAWDVFCLLLGRQFGRETVPLVWERPPQGPSGRTVSSVEFILCHGPLPHWGGERKHSTVLRGSGTGYRRGELIGRANQKPIGLMKLLLSGFPTSSLVVDPFVGSGSTAVAASELGFSRFIGNDLDGEMIRGLRESVGASPA